MTHYTARIVCPSGPHIYEMELINPERREDGTIGGYLGSDADFCRNCNASIIADPVILGDGEPVNTGPQKIGVWLSSEELGLLRAGLAAHSIALDGEHRTILDTGGYTDLSVRDEIRRQKAACRELSIRLGDAQIQIYEAGA